MILQNYSKEAHKKANYYPIQKFHGYVERTCPHLLAYPRYTYNSVNPTKHPLQQPSTDQQQPYVQSKEPTEFDNKLRNAIQELAPYSLTKGEVLMLINLGLGMNGITENNEMDVDNNDDIQGENGEEDNAISPEEIYWSNDRPVLEAVIEDLGFRITPEESYEILRIMEKNFRKLE